MENITLPKSGQYVEAVNTANSMMFRLAFTEYHPEHLTYEEIQAIDATLLRLNDAEVYNDFVVQGVDVSVFRRVFHELLTDPHNTEDWQNVTEPLYFNEERFVKRLKERTISTYSSTSNSYTSYRPPSWNVLNVLGEWHPP